MKRTFTAALLAVLLMGLTVILPASAQNDTGALNLTTSPLPISLVAEPGESVSTSLRIRNTGTQTEILKVGLMKFTASGDDGKPQLMEREAGDDYFDWVTFSEDRFIAEPNEWKEITMTINLPEEAALGYYYAVTFSRAEPSDPADDLNESKVEGATATLVLVEAKVPGAQRNLELENFSVSKSTYEFLPAIFSIKVRNAGNIHGIPSGTIFIRRGSDIVATIPVNETNGNILAGSARTFTSEWNDGFPIYEQKTENGVVVYKGEEIQYKLNWNFSNIKNLRIGKYTAQLTLAYDDGERDVPLEAEVSFWVIPWRLIVIFVVLPLLLIGLVVYLLFSRRKYKKRLVYKR